MGFVVVGFFCALLSPLTQSTSSMEKRLPNFNVEEIFLLPVIQNATAAFKSLGFNFGIISKEIRDWDGQEFGICQGSV